MFLNTLKFANSRLKIVLKYSTVAAKCWKCGVSRQSQVDLFCEKCNVIQAPTKEGNFFKVFNYQNSYNVDMKDLTNKYRKMQSVLHPDKFTNKSKEEQQISEEYSSLVNKAYNTLQIPLSRALHLLSLHGEVITENDKATDQNFLMEMMELNEEIEEAETPDALKALDLKNKQVLSQLALDIAKTFDGGNIAMAKELIIKMKYFNSLGMRINTLLRDRGIVD
ncbi:PREDICTED: iron-sulfur cluster co-chaperone protein HscB, mitochondrial [Nicrophorus vespilloides]|uniref:Iron-sulfur cluster co-chaperone protein HscB, mitochondrial n=1 Tax=Nicrophorus vespilloides TaxID=110193 RepID=A0ABM1N3Y4_NICVS|nr:PREDICTED: iron-sulfur cluster co-chaperone protein HscB, mitochondrial [Nicrophorus vespilloides]